MYFWKILWEKILDWLEQGNWKQRCDGKQSYSGGQGQNAAGLGLTLIAVRN